MAELWLLNGQNHGFPHLIAPLSPTLHASILGPMEPARDRAIAAYGGLKIPIFSAAFLSADLSRRGGASFCPTIRRAPLVPLAAPPYNSSNDRFRRTPAAGIRRSKGEKCAVLFARVCRSPGHRSCHSGASL